MKLMHVTPATTCKPEIHPWSDNWTLQLHELRMDKWPDSVPVVTGVTPLIITLWSPDLKTSYADIEWKEIHQ